MNFEKALGSLASSFGKMLDKGVEAYDTHSTHLVEIKNESGKVLFQAKAPLEPVKKFVEEIGEGLEKVDSAVVGAIDKTKNAVNGVFKTVSGLRVEVKSISKEQVSATPPPPESSNL